MSKETTKLSSLPEWVLTADATPKINDNKNVYKVIIKEVFYAIHSKSKELDCLIFVVTDSKYTLPMLVHMDYARDIVTPNVIPMDIPKGLDMSFFHNKLIEVQRSGVTVWNRKGVAYPLLLALDWTCDINSKNQQIPASLQDVSKDYRFTRFRMQLPKKDDPEYDKILKSSGIAFRKFKLTEKRAMIDRLVNYIYGEKHVGYYKPKEQESSALTTTTSTMTSSIPAPRITTPTPIPPSAYTTPTATSPNESNYEKHQRLYWERKRRHESPPPLPRALSKKEQYLETLSMYVDLPNKSIKTQEMERWTSENHVETIAVVQPVRREEAVIPMEVVEKQIDQVNVRKEEALTPMEIADDEKEQEKAKTEKAQPEELSYETPKYPKIEMDLEEQEAIISDKESTQYERSVALSRFQRLIYFNDCQFVIEPL